MTPAYRLIWSKPGKGFFRIYRNGRVNSFVMGGAAGISNQEWFGLIGADEDEWASRAEWFFFDNMSTLLLGLK